MATTQKKSAIKLITPKEIVEYLDRYVIGQEDTKKTLATAIYNHYKKVICNTERTSLLDFDKSCILVSGATGSGKTYMIQQIAKLLNVGVYIGNANSYTAAGYVGNDVESCLSGLLQVCNYNIEKAEMSIVVIDEIDKLAKKDAGPSMTRDVSGECVQQAFLKMVEGDIVGVPRNQGRIHPEERLTNINTKNILFIGVGAFVGIENMIRRRLGANNIGFETQKARKSDDNDVIRYITGEDLRQFGFIPEFVGRFPIITHTNSLMASDLVRILTEPYNAIIKQFQELLMMDNTKLEITKDALTEIANIALKQKTGARALRSIVEKVLEDIMFSAPDNKRKRTLVKVTVDKNYVIEKTKNIMIG